MPSLSLRAIPWSILSALQFYGYSFSAMVALVAAALDKRAAAVISVTPIADYSIPGRTNVMQCLHWRSMIASPASLAILQYTYPSWDDEGDNPAGWGERKSVEEFQRFPRQLLLHEPDYRPELLLSCGVAAIWGDATS